MTKRYYCLGGILDMDRVREILRLAEGGHSQREIHRATKVARSCIQEYLRGAKLHELTHQRAKELSDSELKALLRKKTPGRPVKRVQEPDFEKVRSEYQSRKGVTLELLWQEWVAETGGGYGYSTFCRRYEAWGIALKVTLRRDYEPGELMLSDFTGEKLCYFEKGEQREAEIFVSVLGLSNRIYAEALPSQQLLPWIGAHSRAFTFFGGVTEAVVIDNLKSGVKKSCRYEPEINRSFQDFAEHYSTTVFPARPNEPRDKSKVENAVQQVERWLLAPLRHVRFNSLAELNAALREKLVELNSREMREYKMSRDEFFTNAEAQSLRALPALSFCAAEWKRARVNLDYHVDVARHWYSVPYILARQEVWVKASERLVEVFFENERVASHQRSCVPHRHTTVPEHMPPHHQAVRSWTADNFKTWASSVGAHTVRLVELLLAAPRYKELAFRSILGLQRLERKYGKTAFEAACGVAVKKNIASQRFVRSVLEQAGSTPLKVSVAHQNIRGPKYFH